MNDVKQKTFLDQVGLNIGLKSLLGLSAASLIFSSSSLAELEEVLVTAQKRDQSLQEVPISISALTGREIDALGLSDRVDVTQQIPNFQVNTWSPNLTTFNIRGVSQNNFIDINEAPIAVYADDIYLGSMNGISGQLYDIERIEVLRGPQGTLFGRNATGGLIHYVSRGATEDEFNGQAKWTFGSFGTSALETAMGGSFMPGFRFRVGVRRDQSDGYIKSAFPGVGNLGGTNSLGYKLQFQVEASDDLQVDFNLHGSSDDRVPTGGYSFLPFGDSATSFIPSEWLSVPRGDNPNLSDAEAEAALRDGLFTNDFAPVSREGLTTYEGDSPNPHTSFSDYTGFLDRSVSRSDVKLRWSDGDQNSVTYIAGWSDLDKFYTEDGDGIRAPIIEFTTEMDYSQLSQELRFNRSYEKGFWQLGLYWMDLTYDGSAITAGAPALGAIGAYLRAKNARDETNVMAESPTANQDFDLETTNLALFAEAEFNFTEVFGMTIGARYTSDDKSISYRRSLSNAGERIAETEEGLTALRTALDDPDYVVDANFYDSFTEGDFAARVVFNLTFGSEDNHRLYLSYNRGIKSGGFNASTTVTRDTIRYDAEVLSAIELGYKADFTDELRLNAAIFSYDYADYQAFSIRDGTPNISNADASAMGMELEFKYTPGRFTLNLGMAYMTSDVDNIQGIDGQEPPGGLPRITFPVATLNNKELPNAPELSFNYLLAYNIRVNDSSDIILQLDGAYYGDQYLEVTNGGGALQKAYNLLNFSLSWNYEIDDAQSVNVRLYGKNLSDEVYKLYNLDLGILGSTAYYAPPVSYGITASYNW